MDDDELLKRRMQEQMMLHQQQKQMEEVLKVVRMQILDTKARERLSNLKVVKPDLAFQLEVYLAQMYQAGQLRTKITDEQLVAILKKMSEKREIRIRRK
ncbi:MAG: DNA-binding protein [Candidatus Aenigmatarchaeota archaeon]